MMSAITRIAIVVAPMEPVASPATPQTVPVREGYRYDDFAAEMARHTTMKVDVLEVPLASIGSDTFVLLHRSVDERYLVGCDPGMTSRIVLLNADRPPILLERLEEWGLAGGVEYNRYRGWKDEKHKESGDGLYGRRDLAPAMGATCWANELFCSEHYCSLMLEGCASLPELLVRYIEAFGVQQG